MRKTFIALLCLLILLIPFEYEYNKPLRRLSNAIVPKELSLPVHFNKSIFVHRSDALILILFFLAIFSLRIPLRRLLFSSPAPLLWSWLALALLSILLSPLIHYPLPYIRLLHILTPCLFFCLIASTAPPMRTILLILVFASLVESAIAIAQYFAQSSLGLSFLGESRHWVGAFRLPSGNRWIFDALFHRSAPTEVIMRTAGTFGHPNLLGGFLAISIFAAYALLCELKRPLWLVFAMPIQFFALCTSFSRSAIFGWVLGTLVWFGLFVFSKKVRPSRLLLIAIGLSLFVSTSLLWEQLFYRGGIVNYNATAKGADSVRLLAQNTAFSLFFEKPLFGHGHYQYELVAHQHGMSPVFPHNIYLAFLVETGLLSLCAFLAFCALLFYATFRSQLTPSILSLIAILIALLFIGGCDHYPLRSQQGKLLFFLAAGLIASHCYQEKRSYVSIAT